MVQSRFKRYGDIRQKSMLVTVDDVDGDNNATVIVHKKYIYEMETEEIKNRDIMWKKLKACRFKSASILFAIKLQMIFFLS